MLVAAAYSGVRVEPREGAQPVRLWKELGAYLLYGGIACVLSVPQLFGFTFGQVFQEGMQEASNSFIQPWFNWVNSTDGTFSGMIDGYGWFYLKNIGLPFLMLIFALFERNGKWVRRSILNYRLRFRKSVDIRGNAWYYNGRTCQEEKKEKVHSFVDHVGNFCFPVRMRQGRRD